MLTGIVTFVSVVLMGQQNNTFYLMHDVPQSNLLNPAVQLRCKWYVGFPGLASGHLSYSNTAFTYNDLAGSDTWNLEGAFNQMHRVDLYSSEAYLHPISIGYRRKSYYFNFNIAEKAHFFQTVPKDLAEIALYGNGPFAGETARFNALRPAGHYYREYSVGVSKVLNQSWTLGVRAKLIFGKANIHTDHSDIDFNTEENSFNLLLQTDYTLSSSFPLTIEQDADGNISDIIINEINYSQLLLNRGNPGFSMDLGFIYRFDEKTTLSASLLDLGFTRWRTDLNNVRTTGTFIFEAVDQSTDVVSFDYLNELVDSIINSMDVSVSQLPYSSFLPPQLYLGGTYQVRENLKVGVVNRNVILRSKIHSSFTLLAQANLADRFLTTLSWSYLNNSILNIGTGIAYHGQGFQFHLVTDNLLGFFNPFNTRTLNLRAGFNVMFGCSGDKKDTTGSYGPRPRGGDCSWTGKPKNREKLLKKAARDQNRR
jgi:hypothetical protein